MCAYLEFRPCLRFRPVRKYLLFDSFDIVRASLPIDVFVGTSDLEEAFRLLYTIIQHGPGGETRRLTVLSIGSVGSRGNQS